MDIKGVAKPNDLLDSYNSLIFVINQFIKNTINTVELVRVELINEDGTIDVIPVVKRETADGTYAENGTIPNVKYIQYQAGTNAVIVKPQVGDIGLLLINKRDISNAQGGIVATNRMFNPCDGIYLGGVFGLNQNPVNFIEVNETGTHINGGKLEVKNESQSLALIMTEFLTACENIMTGSDSTPIPLTNNSKTAFTTVKNELMELLQ